MKWTEISNEVQNKRFEILSKELKDSNFENQYIATELPIEYLEENFFAVEQNCDQFKTYFAKVKNEFDQMRVGGFFRDHIDLLSSEYPAELIQTKNFDSLVKSDSHWWPRNQLYHGFIYFLLPQLKEIDFSAPVLIAGANSAARTVIAALIKLGFSRFNITDLDPQKCKQLVQELKKIYFSSYFEMTDLGYVTQLPNIYSMGINTLEGEIDEEVKMALIYFNFLPKGAFWIETSPRKLSALVDEASSFGFQVHIGLDLVASVDSEWSKSALKCVIDQERYRLALASKLF